ncbi:hypothetical protein, partial [Listeria monocytogenes]|uniref:hypothetical protein n=1 Tax=Listeria monocytogenes TaxID=1639 RepID=UPI003FA48408
HLENSGDHLFSAGLAVVLLHPDPQSLDRLVEATLTDLNALPGRPFVPVEGGLIPFMALSPFSTLSNDERVT